jgi:CheY-like chemotaxis protein
VSVVLQGNGFDVRLAEDGQAALERLAEELPSVILCDVVMPRLDGYETLAAIRSNPRTRALPVVMVSARSQPQDIQRALEGGADGYVVKPFQMNQLLNEVQRCLAIQHHPIIETSPA